jgi:hypothetical protein
MNEVKHGIRCPILPNWATQKNGSCKRWYRCGFRADPRCPAEKKS